MKLAIIGASGAVGLPTLHRLSTAQQQMKVFTSNPGSAERLRVLGGVTPEVGDVRNHDDVVRFCAGVDSLIYIPPAMQSDEAEFGKSVVAAAREAGVRRIIYVSCFHSVISAMAHHHHKLLVEEAVVESGLQYVILQPSMLMQNMLLGLKSILEEGVVAWPWDPDAMLNFVDAEDLADAIVKAVGGKRLDGGTYEISGPENLSVADTAKILSSVLGREIVARKADPDLWAQHIRSLGMKDWGVSNLLAMSAYYDSKGFSGGNPLVAEMVLGRPATSYRAFVERVLPMHKQGN